MGRRTPRPTERPFHQDIDAPTSLSIPNRLFCFFFLVKKKKGKDVTFLPVPRRAFSGYENIKPKSNPGRELGTKSKRQRGFQLVTLGSSVSHAGNPSPAFICTLRARNYYDCL